MSQLPLSCRCSRIDSPRLATAVELALTNSLDIAVALVLDLSDSARGLEDLVRRVPKLLNRLPRTVPIWLYQLSQPKPLRVKFEGSASSETQSIEPTTGHLNDGSIDLSRFLQDRKLVAQATSRGSFLGPVISSIASRRASEGVAEVWVIVLTDGLLTDFWPISNAKGIRVLGLLSGHEEIDKSRWRRIFPGAPLLKLDSAEIDEWLDQSSDRAISEVAVNIEHHGNGVLVVGPSGPAKPAAAGGCIWKPQDGSFLAVLDGPSGDWSIMVRTGSPPTSIVIRKSNCEDEISETARSRVQKAVGAGKPAVSTILFDSHVPGVERSDQFLEDAVEAMNRAKKHESWGEPSERELFRELCSGATDAIVCFVQGDLGGHGFSVVIAGLSKNTSPALYFERELQSPLGKLRHPFQVLYDRMEGRWMVTANGAPPVEFNPRGSDILSVPIRTSDGTEWRVAFSGNLRQG